MSERFKYIYKISTKHIHQGASFKTVPVHGTLTYNRSFIVSAAASGIYSLTPTD